jgi:hypothetical protein
MRCTAPVQGHRTASGRANCPACGSRSYYRPSDYIPPVPQYRSSGGGSSSGGTPSRSGGRTSATYTAAERRTLEPVRREAEQQARSHPERRDLFLCHAWVDRLGAAKELHDLLESLDVTVWFRERTLASVNR